MQNFVISGVLTEATGRPYTGVLDTAKVNFSLVPDQGYNSFTGRGTSDFDLSLARDIHLENATHSACAPKPSTCSVTLTFWTPSTTSSTSPLRGPMPRATLSTPGGLTDILYQLDC